MHRITLARNSLFNEYVTFQGFGSPPNQFKDKIGWATSRAMYLGRTQYTVLMYDSLSDKQNTKPWNVTFFDYTSHTMAPEVSKEYGTGYLLMVFFFLVHN